MNIVVQAYQALCIDEEGDKKEEKPDSPSTPPDFVEELLSRICLKH